jgi:hypothetical protein
VQDIDNAGIVGALSRISKNFSKIGPTNCATRTVVFYRFTLASVSFTKIGAHPLKKRRFYIYYRYFTTTTDMVVNAVLVENQWLSGNFTPYLPDQLYARFVKHL